MPSSVKTILLPVLLLFFLSCENVGSDRVCVKNKCYTVEIVDKDESRRQGLQFRESLPLDRGMLFIFADSRPQSFWMKDTKIPLDIIWLDESRRVVYIAPDAQPCLEDPCLSHTPTASAMYVLEINAGESRRLGLKVGDTLVFKLERYLSH